MKMDFITYGTIRHLAIHRLAFPFGLYLPYLARVYEKETTRLPSVICTFYSIHPDPNHVDESYRSYLFRAFLKDMPSGKGFPGFPAGHPASPPPLVYVLFWAGLCPCRPFRFPFTGGHPVCQSFPHGLGPLLRLRHFKG